MVPLPPWPAQARGATYAIGTRGNSWQLTAQDKMPAAHKVMVHVAKVMAGTAIDVIRDEMLLTPTKADHQERVARTPYVPATGRCLAASRDVAGGPRFTP
jgi:aminobenzoyl-glutamate utilization protein B